jgi:iron complex transport system substrate-binding protein
MNTLEGVEGSEGVEGWGKELKKAGLLVRVAAIVLTFGAMASAQETPTRVVSLVPALTEMVFAIGAGDRVVAVSSYDTDPPEVKTLPRVGALLDPDVERIIALRADLVLLYGSQTDLIAQLTRASIPYFEYRHGGLATVTGTVRALGERLGRSPQAEALARGIDDRLTTLRRRTATLVKPRVMLVFSRERGTLRNIYASGGRGFLHEMLEAAGGVNVFADIDAESVQASTELVLARAPDVILELRPTDIPPPGQQIAEMQSWRTLASIPAVRNHRLHFLPGRSFVVPGPRVAEGAEAMAQLLHGLTGTLIADRRFERGPRSDSAVGREPRAEGRTR